MFFAMFFFLKQEKKTLHVKTILNAMIAHYETSFNGVSIPTKVP